MEFELSRDTGDTGGTTGAGSAGGASGATTATTTTTTTPASNANGTGGAGSADAATTATTATTTTPAPTPRGTLFLRGDFAYNEPRATLRRLRDIARTTPPRTLDFAALTRIDFAAAQFLLANFPAAEFANLPPKFARLFALLRTPKEPLPPAPRLNFIERIGRLIHAIAANFYGFCCFLGEFISASAAAPLNLRRIRFRELFNFVKDAGITAVFIVGLTSFLIGIVLAYQGVAMLSNFGASVLVVEIMGVMSLREISPLIAAIVVAGRSASSFTAQIGVMKITEELDAMRVMGFAPFEFCVLPRVWGLIVAMPFVVFLADLASLVGQMFVCEFYLGFTASDFVERLAENVSLKHFWLGLLKAPFFGATIALIGCLRGFEVSSSTNSIGELTTKSVVNAIFWVIALDAIFSIIFTGLDL